MFLPEAVLRCIRILEEAGHEAYAVGGCVRDSLLGLPPHDYDLCTSAVPEETARLFSQFSLVRSGEKHGTIGVVIDGEVLEITTFRTEGGYQDSRHPDWVRFVSRIEEDLARRDFTVNAMAYNPSTGYVDPFGGRQDLQSQTLRAVGDPKLRFSEDALRIIRGVRFAVRFHLTPEPATMSAMAELAPLMEQLARERIFDELCKLLPLVTAQDLLTYIPILTQVLPELAPGVDFDQHSPHHRYDVFTHTAHVVESMPPTLSLRWAALLHDCGKPASFVLDENGRGHFKGHAQISAQMADLCLTKLKAPTALREQVLFLISHHMTIPDPDKKTLRRQMGKYGISLFMDLLTLQEADFAAKGTGSQTDVFVTIRNMTEEILAEPPILTVKNLSVNGNDLVALGFAPGPQLGECLMWLLEQVQSELLPNEPAQLLDAAITYWNQQPHL